MLALKGWNTSKSRRTQTMLLPVESLKLTPVSSLSSSGGLRNMAALMLFAIESHSSSQHPCPNQPMKPTPKELTHSLSFVQPSASCPCRPFAPARPWLSWVSLGAHVALAAQDDHAL